MATTGRMPCVASPAAKVVACPSAMPTSKNRSGHFFWKVPVPVPEGMAAVMATSSGCSPASCVSASPNSLVHCGGPPAAALSSPVAGSYGARAWNFSRSGSSSGKPFPFCVSTCSNRGPLSWRIFSSASIKARTS